MKISHGLAEMADVPTTGRDEAPAQVVSYWGRKSNFVWRQPGRFRDVTHSME